MKGRRLRRWCLAEYDTVLDMCVGRETLGKEKHGGGLKALVREEAI